MRRLPTGEREFRDTFPSGGGSFSHLYDDHFDPLGERGELLEPLPEKMGQDEPCTSVFGVNDGIDELLMALLIGRLSRVCASNCPDPRIDVTGMITDGDVCSTITSHRGDCIATLDGRLGENLRVRRIPVDKHRDVVFAYFGTPIFVGLDDDRRVPVLLKQRCDLQSNSPTSRDDDTVINRHGREMLTPLISRCSP